MNDTMTTALLSSGDFLQAGSMQRICEAVHFPQEVTQALLIETARIAADTERAAAARGSLQALFVDQDRPSGEVNKELLNYDDGAILAAVVYAGAIPQLWARYEQRGISAQVLIDTVQDIVIWMETHRKRHGQWGLSELGWLHSHMTGGLYKIGRLQFQPMANPYAARVFRHRLTGEHVALAEAGTTFLADGRLAGASDDSAGSEDGEWISAYTFDGQQYAGHPISDMGIASRETVQLPADTWELALQQGDNVLNVHIPEGSRMTHDACRESYADAARLFADCFPDQPFNAFVCSSWLLSPEFREWLPVHSNIRQFQSDYHLLPLISDETQTLERVFGFGTKLADLPDLKPETSLQRVIYDRLTAGESVHNGCGFILKK
ncbi:hypothetical protein GZH47_30685 [Paenibacillus rhizovicinus]|uniref:GNAT-like C-terminal domain-containing protein n=1 Tax=Paenibacillus rhizovicinus TaxID=2704463 RepID=A0A6C0P8M9_9BACL|nr:acyltransferase domain-containing protein [Paenibacillus rhizovicinus]QHW34735.1 hypothetical protein GZH47_30685 [Paenibacillus rhizovicinus]